MKGKRSGANGLIGAERRRKICELVSQRGWVNVTLLAQELGVTTDTIRADLDKLDKEGILARTHGGAVAREGLNLRPSYSETRDTHLMEKSWIGRAALAHLPESGSVYISAGSTTFEMIKRMNKGLQIQIYTASIRNAEYLVSNGIATVNFPGGVINLPTLSSDWSMSGDIVEELYWDVSFMGAPAIDIDRGISEMDRHGAQIFRKLMEHSEKVVMLCDSSKLGSISHAVIGPITLLDVLVTDHGANPEYVKALQDRGIQVVLAGPDDHELLSTSTVDEDL